MGHVGECLPLVIAREKESLLYGYWYGLVCKVGGFHVVAPFRLAVVVYALAPTISAMTRVKKNAANRNSMAFSFLKVVTFLTIGIRGARMWKWWGLQFHHFYHCRDPFPSFSLHCRACYFAVRTFSLLLPV